MTKQEVILNINAVKSEWNLNTKNTHFSNVVEYKNEKGWWFNIPFDKFQNDLYMVLNDLDTHRYTLITVLASSIPNPQNVFRNKNESMADIFIPKNSEMIFTDTQYNGSSYTFTTYYKYYYKKHEAFKYWLISSNPERYDSIQAFKNLSEVDWGNASNNHINIDDIVYIYIGKPLQKIVIKAVVIKSDFGESELLNNDKKYINENELRLCEKYFRLKLIKFIDNDLLTIDKLHKNGINGNIQGKRTVDGTALAYILKYDGSQIKDERAISFEEINADFEKEIVSAKYMSHGREERLAKASKQPEEVQVISRAFKRNADVVVAVLERANGFCERCECKAPFTRKKDNTPYLEVHHKIQLAEGGEDSIENAIAVCPNCHRELHFGV